jgi:glycosyl transferase family 25
MNAFPPCLVINLDRDSDRLAHMERECSKAGIAFTRFPALRGDALPTALLEFFPEPTAPERALLSNGEIGCYASHLAICKKIIDGEIAAPVLVLEDDVELSPSLNEDVDALLQALPDEWDLVRLSNETKHAFAPIVSLKNNRRLIRYAMIPDSTGAMLWSRAGAQKFYKQTQRLLAIDQDLRRPWAWSIDTYGVTPAPVKRDALGQSTIEDMAGKTWRSVRWRVSRMRSWRSKEAWMRHRHGIATFGAFLWAQLLLINVMARTVRKPKRLNFIERQCLRLRTHHANPSWIAPT